jgi:RsmE family RNA methyltransferase
MNIVLFSENDKDSLNLDYFFSQQDDRAKHILKILHKQVGETFDAGIENGMAGIATILSIDSEKITFNFRPTSDGKPLYPLEMIIGFPRPIQLKRLFRDMASLGVCKIHLCGTELGEKSYLDSKIIERGTASNLLKDGTIQAKSTHIPELHTYQSVKDCLTQLNLDKNKDDTLQIVLDNVDAPVSLSTFLKTYPPAGTIHFSRVIASIGSERGWTNTERFLFEETGFTRCNMGERILRTETAATVATTVILENIFNIL